MVFEVTVDGPLGALLRAALLPRRVVWSGACTVLRTSCSGRDLDGLVADLTCQDLTVDSVSATATTPVPGHAIQGPCQPPSAATRVSAPAGPHEPGA